MGKSRKLPQEEQRGPIPPLTNEFAGQLVEMARSANMGLMMLLKDNPETNQLIVGIGINVSALGALAVALSRQTKIDTKELEALCKKAMPWWDVLAESYGEETAKMAEELLAEAQAQEVGNGA